jgi:hypothetical protein
LAPPFPRTFVSDGQFTPGGPHLAHPSARQGFGVATDQTFVPLISDNWMRNLTWTGDGPFQRPARALLGDARAAAAARDRLAGAARGRVDFINTDHLDTLETFLLQNDPNPTEPYVYWHDRDR